MQVSSTIVIVAAELCVALLIGSIILFVYARKLKALNKKQNTKLLSLVAELKNSARDPQPSGIDPAEHERQLEACKKRAESAAATTLSEKDTLIQDLQEQLQLKASAGEESETSVQILKEELLKAQEELSSVQDELASKEQMLAEQAEQALAEQAQRDAQKDEESQGSTEALENLTLENQELAARLTLLESENNELKQVIADTPTPRENTGTSESFATVEDSEEKDQLISELEEQLQRQIRSTQEAETCVQVLSKELLRGKEAIAREEKMLAAQQLANEENLQLKSTLENLSLESKDLLARLNALESENTELKQNISEAALAAAENDTAADIQEKEALILELQQQLEQQTQAAATQLEEAETLARDIEARAQLLDKELASAQEDLAKQRKALAEQTEITAENQQLKQALEDITQQSTDLQDKLDTLQTAMSEFKQGKLPPESTDPAAAVAFKEQEERVQQLQEQLQQQTLSTQESEALAQILSKELVDLKQALASQEKALKDQEKILKKQALATKEAQSLEAQRQEAQRLENQELKEALEKLSQESQELTAKLSQENQELTTRLNQESEDPTEMPSQETQELIAKLSQENEELKAKLSQENEELKAKLSQESEELKAKLSLLEAENTALKQESSQATSGSPASDTLKFKKLQAQYKDLQNEYAELEEKYTELTNL